MVKIPDDKVIRVTGKGRPNPKTPGTYAQQQYELLLEYDGRPIGEFRAAAAKRSEIAQLNFRKSGKNWAHAELRWCLDHGFIALDDPK